MLKELIRLTNVRWNVIVSRVFELWELQNAENFVSNCEIIRFSRRILF